MIARVKRSWWVDALGVLWVVAAAVAVLAPALSHGAYLGAFDWVSRYGLSSDPSVAVHNRQAFDQITEFIPWTNLAWTEVHSGHLPLWNPYTVLGMPLAFNWQAGAFGVPALIGYLFPLRLAYTVQVVVTLLIAGTGVYVLGRVLRLSVVGCAMAATVYELSGPFFGWLGWPIASVMSWAGWLFAAVVLVVRSRHRARAVTFLALVVACAVYAGQPDTLVVLASALLVFLVALFAARAPRFGGSGPIRRPVLDTVLGLVTGAALSGPLLLPGLQLLSGTDRTGDALSKALPVPSLLMVLFQSFDGTPVAGSRWFGTGYYTKAVAYVGVIAVVLALVAVAGALKLRWRRRETIAFGAVALVMAGIVYIPLAESFLDGLPIVGNVLWRRATIVMTFALAVLAGMGADVVIRSYRSQVVRRWAGAGFGAAAVVLLAVWTFGRGRLPPVEASIRVRSFIWPVAATALGLAVVAGLWWWSTRPSAASSSDDDGSFSAGRIAAALLLACETAFLVTAGTSLWSSSSRYLAPTRAETELARAVGSSMVGFGTNTCYGDQLGIVPDYNVALGVKELAAYEPLLPRRYGSSWRQATGQSAAPVRLPIVPFSVFCPAVTTTSVARRYGVRFVLEPSGKAGPSGAVFDRAVGDEELYRIPGAGLATLTPVLASGALPGLDARGTVVPVTQPDPGSWKVVTDGAGPQVLRLRLTDVPGWHASIDGRQLPLQRFAGVMLQARIPAGHHVIELSYWPVAFTAGLVLAGGGAAVLCGFGLVEFLRRRRPSTSPAATS